MGSPVYLLPEFVRKLNRGDVLTLAYNDGNTGIFDYLFDSYTEEKEMRVHGAFSSYGDDSWSSVDDYLYEFGGVICRGSGAERCIIIGLKRVSNDVDD